ncbi:hypothetical protein LPJ38_31665 [Bradyrhizobium daqingense]|uniref:Uncharacterized protein n=1 Tax=Bradyrhizobium daqingense TaxID=993502 RepID=A0A562LQC2_9BRAD|nr:hypothetical protein [Bradyrhizobium daqingense]TWI09831.1 hypothetical protein IQ17_00911 [Bradyrhizobium daqingense]UFS88149.1 hypothetical protein LPJ38_31665 [Bradyrhizobium daqingense]
MDDDFIKTRAEHIRELAAKADPFTKKRLLDLASAYERRLRPATSPAARAPGAHVQPRAKQ